MPVPFTSLLRRLSPQQGGLRRTRAEAMYCSASCRVKAWRKRQRPAAEDPKPMRKARPRSGLSAILTTPTGLGPSTWRSRRTSGATLGALRTTAQSLARARLARGESSCLPENHEAEEADMCPSTRRGSCPAGRTRRCHARSQWVGDGQQTQDGGLLRPLPAGP